MRDNFVSKRGGFNSLAFTVVLWKRGLNNKCEQQRYHEKHKNTKQWLNFPSKSTLWKQIGPNGSNYCALRKSRVAPRTLPAIRPYAPLEFVRWKSWSTNRFWEIPKIENGTKIDQWKQTRHRDHQKTLCGGGFEKAWNINDILIGRWNALEAKNMPKPSV